MGPASAWLTAPSDALRPPKLYWELKRSYTYLLTRHETSLYLVETRDHLFATDW